MDIVTELAIDEKLQFNIFSLIYPMDSDGLWKYNTESLYTHFRDLLNDDPELIEEVVSSLKART